MSRSNTMITENALSRGLSWVETMRQKGGYGGPVVHYWNQSLQYIGPRCDWRVEGLLSTFLALDRVVVGAGYSNNGEWLSRAIQLGEQVTRLQRGDGSYIISDFEETPSFWHSAQPHESAVDIGLLLLGERLGEEGKSYTQTAEKNIQQILIQKFWNEKEQSFQQYQRGQFDNAPNLFVPNKIATACEALLRLEKLTDKKEYLDYAVNAAQKILAHQSDEKEMRGGIFQSNTRDKIITLYTARCVRPLLLLAKTTKEKKYATAAKEAVQFVVRHQNEDGSFDFGIDSNGERIRFPRFVAGSGEMLSAMHAIGDFDREIDRGTKWMLSHQHENGGIASFEGITQKNTHDNALKGTSWMDELPVVGWNDKALRFLAETCNPKWSTAPHETVWKMGCVDGTIREDHNSIRIDGASSYYFGKKEHFSQSPLNPVKESFLLMATQSNTMMRSLGSLGFRFVVRL